MRYYRLQDGTDPRLIARTAEDAYDLTAVKPTLESFVDLASAAVIGDSDVDSVAERHLDRAPSVDVDRVEREAVRPVVPEEVWAAGITYQISEEARESESTMPDVYLDVYESDRPEVFFKSTASRTVGPGEAVGIRADSDWDVPEPELGIVLYDEEIVGYTIGNDVSSRSIEGANPLYLPQAKIYDRSCSIGPSVVSADAVEDPHDLEMEMEIRRDGETVFDGDVSTSEMARTCEELVDYYTRHNDVPELSVLLTGTSLVPPDEFTLKENDEVEITIEGIGTLENHVITL